MDDNGSTRKKILKTAMQIFADKGFEGARMDQIAKAANVNKATIYYNIGNKKALYEQVLVSETMKPVIENASKELNSLETPEKKLETYILSISKFFLENPHLPKISMREQISGGKNLPPSFISNISQMLKTLESILKEGEKSEVFEKVDTLTIHFMIIASLMFFINSAPIRAKGDTLPERFSSADDKAYAEFTLNITKYILKAVRKGE